MQRSSVGLINISYFTFESSRSFLPGPFIRSSSETEADKVFSRSSAVGRRVGPRTFRIPRTSIVVEVGAGLSAASVGISASCSILKYI